MRLALVFVLVLSVGCKRQTPVPVKPAPPASQPKPHATIAPPRSGDVVVRNCTLTKETNGRVDCICRHANTHIDSTDTSKQSLVCR
jgi:hypothetical protein